jgi:hypothetical protein
VGVVCQVKGLLRNVQELVTVFDGTNVVKDIEENDGHKVLYEAHCVLRKLDVKNGHVDY